MEGYGIDPSQTRGQALDVGVRTAEAAAKAAAGTGAVQRVEDVGRALRADVVNLGRGVPSQVAQSYSTSLNAGNSANQNALANTASGAQTMGTAPQWMGHSMQGYGSAGQMSNQMYQNQLQAHTLNHK